MQKTIFTALLLFASSVMAAMDMPVKVEATADDRIGRRLVFSLKEKIEESAFLHITHAEQVALGISIVTLEGDRNNPGYYTTYSATIVWHNPEMIWPFYLTSSVGTCGADRVDSCAHSLLTDIYEQAESMYLLLDAVNSLPSN